MPVNDPLELRIKGMVCDRCIRVLESAFEEAGLKVESIRLGSVKLSGTHKLHSLTPLRQLLEKHGFGLLEDSRQNLIKQAQDLISQYYQEEVAFYQEIRLSTFLNQEMNMHYDSLSALFSSLTGLTLDQYAQQQRLHKVKELLVYSNMTLMEIAARTGFSSTQHLSSHFKSQLGLPPSHFRQLQARKKKVQGGRN
ncbi:helix-turn-helix transcriptional regulator [Porifericola rhodea]|uniref:AraC family transcriptional regulator n=1 Tax=Porifericola rhodea TaxID=930972 RepID=UPI002665007A|nr:helix-turn-helix domain-containing protein [Porifericola rhodea]WKN32696.1 helix-turn-helix transcriptional regulator [Porifericola rhodea]